MKHLALVLALAYTSIQAEPNHLPTITLRTPMPTKALVASPDGSHIAYQDTNNMVFVRPTAHGEATEIGQSIVAPIFTPNGTRVIIGDKKSIKDWDIQQGLFERIFPRPATPIAELRVSTPDRLRNVSPGLSTIWESPNGTFRVFLDGDNLKLTRAAVDPTEPPFSTTLGTAVSKPVISPDSGHVYFTDGDKLSIWDATQPTAIRRIQLPIRINDLSLSADGNALLMYEKTDRIKRLLLFYPEHKKSINLAATKPVTMATFGGTDRIIAATDSGIEIWYLERFVPTTLAPPVFAPIIAPRNGSQTPPDSPAHKRRRMEQPSPPEKVRPQRTTGLGK